MYIVYWAIYVVYIPIFYSFNFNHTPKVLWTSLSFHTTVLFVAGTFFLGYPLATLLRLFDDFHAFQLNPLDDPLEPGKKKLKTRTEQI